MKMISELKPLFLYPANRRFYAPFDDKDRRRGAAILLLTPNMETSAKLMNLPYMYDPSNLFSSFFIDRNISAYIADMNDNDIEFDEKEEETLSEALIESDNTKIDFVFDNNTPIIAKRHTEPIFNNRYAMYIAKMMGIKYLPKRLDIIVHSSLDELRAAYKFSDSDKIFSFTENGNIHIIPKILFREKEYGGTYEIYLANELAAAIILNVNPRFANNRMVLNGLTYAVSGKLEWMLNKENEYSASKKDSSIKLARTFSNMIKDRKYPIIYKCIKTEDMSPVVKEIEDANIASINSRILKAIDDIDKIRASFKAKNESASIDNENDDTEYNDVLSICNTLSKEEMSKISFTPEYKNSEFVIKRIVYKVDSTPAGFLDVYLFPSKPEIAQITLAVNSNYRGMGIANAMVKELMDLHLENEYGFNIYYWTAHIENIASQKTALRNGFIDTNLLDKYNRKVFVKVVKDFEGEIPSYIPINRCPCKELEYGEYGIKEESSKIYNEANNPDESMYSKRIRKYLYTERLKNRKEVMQQYDKIKPLIPSSVKRMFPNIELYKRFNIFVDTSYYHAIFLRKNSFKRDKAINFYFNFLNRLLNNPDIDAIYKKKTIFIPIDVGVWGETPGSDITDWKVNLNPISIIWRLVRTNLPLLRKEWGNKTILFVGSRGYFTVDFSTLEFKNLARFKRNLDKLRSNTEKIVDEFEPDEDNENDEDTDSKKAIAIKTIDNIERTTGMQINNVSKLNNLSKAGISDINHLVISSDKLSVNKNDDNGTVILSIDNDLLSNNSPVDISKFSKYYSVD